MKKYIYKTWAIVTTAIIFLSHILPVYAAAQSITMDNGIFRYQQVEGGVRIDGFSKDYSNKKLEIPDTIDNQPVVEIGSKAFMQEDLTEVILGSNVKRVNDYAFASNQIQSIQLNNELQTIGSYAFRDNTLNELNLKNVQIIEKEAFSNNQLEHIEWSDVQTIGDYAFIFNMFSEVHMPDSVKNYGKGVFADNGRYVLIHTNNPLIKTEVISERFGQVVNPVTVTVRSVDQDTGEKIVDDYKIGTDFYDLNGLIFLNEENTYTPDTISGYHPVEEVVTYTPDSTDYVLTIEYKNRSVKPIIETVKSPTLEKGADGSKEALLSFVKATDQDGKDISDTIEVTPKSIDTSVSGSVDVVYSVTDEAGNKQTHEVTFMVGADWFSFELGKGWTLGDFVYDKNKVVGFSKSGLKKVQTQKDLILPHLNPHDGSTIIDTVAENNDTNTSFYSKGLTTVKDYSGTIKTIEDGDRTRGVFSNNKLESVELSKLETAGDRSFENNRLERIKFPELKIIGSSAFSGNKITMIEEEDLPKVEALSGVWHFGSGNKITKVHMPNLVYIESTGFIDNPITDAYFPKLEYVGPNTFAENKLTEVSEVNFPALKHIMSGGFRTGTIEKVSLKNIETIENAFASNPIKEVNSEFPNLKTIGNSAFSNWKVIEEVYAPKLEKIGQYAFNGNPGSQEWEGKVAVWTDNPLLNSKENYLINPTHDFDPDPFWKESDFIWDSENTHRVLALSPLGRKKLSALDYKLELPNRARIIGESAFIGLGIVSVKGQYVETIEQEGLDSNKLTNINDSFPNLKEVGRWAFYGNKLEELKLPRLERVADEAFLSNSIQAVDLPETTFIGRRAFWGARNKVLTLELPKVKTIEQEAFSYHELQELHLPSVEKIGASAFALVKKNSAGFDPSNPAHDRSILGYDEKPLVSLDLPQVKEIGDLAFAGHKLSELELPNAEKIGRRAFEGDEFKSLKTITLTKAKTVGPKAFANNRVNEAYFSKDLAQLETDAFYKNRNINKDRREVFVFIEDRQNPHQIEDGYVSGVRQHIINPTKVTVSYLDENDNELADGFSEYIYKDKTYESLAVFNYLVDKDKKTVKDNRQENHLIFRYEKQNYDEKQTGGIELWQDYESDQTSGNRKQFYKIGQEMTTYVYMDLTGFDSSISDGKLSIYFDPKYIDPSSIRIPSSTSIKEYKVRKLLDENGGEKRDELKGIIDIYLNPIDGGFQMQLPIIWKFKKYVTPLHFPFDIHAVFESNDKVISVAKPITLYGYYNLPAMEKSSPVNVENGKNLRPTDNGPRNFGEIVSYLNPDGTIAYKIGKEIPVRYDFRVTGLDRTINQVTITDDLPTYMAVKEDGTLEERTAVFDPKLNPDWVLSGNTVSQTKKLPATIYPSRHIEPLYLSFPDMKADYNVKNTAHIEMVPDDKYKEEENFTVSDDLSIYAEYYQDVLSNGDPRFEKMATGTPHGTEYQTYFYDIPSERNRTIPFLLRVSSLGNQSDLKEVVLTDYGLDERLYYSGISFPRDSHTAGNTEVTVVAYKQLGEKMNPKTDQVLDDETVIMSEKNSVIFEEEYAKDIDYVQIYLPPEHKVISALEFHINTKLKNPEEPHYSTAGAKDANIFKNYAVMASNLYKPETNQPASQRGDITSPETGGLASKYSEEWDNLPGNYIWGVHAQVAVRDYSQRARVRKTQTYPTNQTLFPGATGDYHLSIEPEAYSKEYPVQGDAMDNYTEDYNNFVMVDLLPKGINPTKVTLSNAFKRAGGYWEFVENYQGTKRDALVFKADKVPGSTRSIATVGTEIDFDVDEGFIENEVFWDFDNEKIEKSGVKKQLPGSEKDWMYDSVHVRVVKANEMAARKYIRKSGTAGEIKPWSVTGVITESEEPIDYRISLYNNLDQPRDHVDIVDFFPYVGDESIQELNIGKGDRKARESEFENTFDLTREVKVPEGYSIRYWNSDEPIDYQGTSADKVIEKLTWSEKPAKNTRAIRITAEAGTVLAPHDSLHAIVPMKAPKNTIENDFDLSGKRAYNTYVRKDNQTIRFVEPNRVYNELAHPTGSIQFNKYGIEGNSVPDSVLDEAVHPLEGATFELYNSKEELVGQATSDAEGVVKFEEVVINDTYTIKEVSAPDGYQASLTELKVTAEMFKKQFAVTGNFDVQLSREQELTLMNHKPIFGDVSIDKVNADSKPLGYIRFHLVGRDSDEVIYDKLGITNRNGQLKFTQLPEGQYELTEILDDHKTGYIPVTPQKFVVNRENRTFNFTKENAIVNEKVRLMINKVAVSANTDLSQSLADLTNFGLRMLSGYKFTITEVGKPSNTIETEASVDGIVKVNHLKVNTLYEISEVEKDGNSIYNHNAQKYRFKINDNGWLEDENGKEFRQNILNFPNPEKEVEGEVEVVKLDDENHPLEGAEFGIYNSNGQLLDKQTTKLDKENKAKVIFKDLKGGVYTIKEIRAPKNYVKSEAEQTVIIPQRPNDEMLYDPSFDTGSKKIIKKVAFEYHNAPFEIEVIKGHTLKENVSISFAEDFIASNPEYRYRRKGDQIVDIYLPLKGVKFRLDEETVEGKWSPVREFVSDGEGQLPLLEMEWDQSKNYRLVEIETLPDYQLDATPIELNLRRLSQLDSFDGTIYRFKENSVKQGQIIISKYDEENRQILKGATFGLYKKDNLETPIKEATTDSSGFIVFKDLPLDAEYVVKEISAPEGYQILPQTFEVHLTKEQSSHTFIVNNPKLRSIVIRKEWEGPMKKQAVVQLLADGKSAKYSDGKLVEDLVLNKGNNWKVTVDKLPVRDESGKEIEYTIIENAIENYTSEISKVSDNEFLVKNINNEVTEIHGEKVWQDAHDQDGKRPESITVQLLADGKVIKEQLVSAKNHWKFTFDNLPKYDKGNEIEYEVKEVPIEGYESKITGTVEEGFTITNTHTPKTIPEVVQVSVQKIWDDNNDKEGKRPESITIQLLANGHVIKEQSVTAKDYWKFTFKELPKYENGKEIHYEVHELRVSGYESNITGDAVSGFTITNKRKPKKELPKTGEEELLWSQALVSLIIGMIAIFMSRLVTFDED